MNPLGGLPKHTQLILLFFIAFIIVAVPLTSYILSKNQNTVRKIVHSSPTPTPKTLIVSDREKAQIDDWIKKNGLNQYGDSMDIAYAGGTPLFDETTGKTEDRYQYIAEKHPNRPWCTPRPACLDSTPRCLIAESTDMCPSR